MSSFLFKTSSPLPYFANEYTIPLKRLKNFTVYNMFSLPLHHRSMVFKIVIISYFCRGNVLDIHAYTYTQKSHKLKSFSLTGQR